jgi:site-specific DNA-methyltransferase (adenine-specific)
MNIEWVKTKDIIPNENNPRILKDDKFKKLVQSIKDFPEMLEIRPIVVNNEMMILGGNMRWKAIQEIGIKEIPIIKAESLTEEQQREFLIKDNVGFGEWDWDALANDWDPEELNEWGLDVPNMDLTELEAEDDNFEEPENVETDIVLGDLFEIGEHRLLCGDSTDSDAVARLMDGQKADMVFTDPPYGISYKSNWASKERERFDEIKNDDVILDILPSIILLSKNNIHWYIWTSHQVYSIWRGKFDEYYKSTIIWSKKSGAMGDLEGDYIVNYEMALFCHYGRKTLNGKRESAVWDLTRDSGIDYQHPTQKPISLAEKAIINSSNQNDLVADLFLGSGTTMVASHQLKRKCYGMELDPKYCQVIIDRMKKLDPTIKIKKNGVEI